VIFLAIPSGSKAGGMYLVILALLLAGWGLFASRFWPWTNCWYCKGKSRFRAPGGKSWRDCPRCGGTGKRRRVFSGKEDKL
jgi:hypothetical protein